MKKHLLMLTLALALALTLGFSAQAASDHDGQVVKMEGNSTLYYVIEGKRYVFPNAKIYNSWFTDFADVVVLEAEELYALPLAGNVRYRPGVMLVKIQTDPKVYAVGQNGKLRWIKTEALARKLYGNFWNKLVDDVPDSFFTDYEVDEPIDEEADYDPDTEAGDNSTIEANRGLKLGEMVRKKAAQTVRCRMAERLQNRLDNAGRNVPAVLERVCRADDDSENSGDSSTDDADASTDDSDNTDDSTTGDDTADDSGSGSEESNDDSADDSASSTDETADDSGDDTATSSDDQA